VSDRSLLRASLLLSTAVLGVAVFILLDGRGGRSSASSTPPAVVEQTPSTRAAQPAQPAQDAAFWRLIEQTRSAAGDDTSRQSELLKDRLTRLRPAAILEFARTRHRLDQQAYTWSLWGAAAVIDDGCSQDCFRDFRAYVISLGRNAYEDALRNPDSLASVAQNAETGNWEDADNVAPDAYSSVTGNDFPLSDSDLSGRPAGAPLDLDRAAQSGRYPQLTARFR
jgi:hypothetical protein